MIKYKYQTGLLVDTGGGNRTLTTVMPVSITKQLYLSTSKLTLALHKIVSM